MRVQLKSLLANPQRVARPGQIVDLAASEARALVAAGYATHAEDTPQPPTPQPEPTQEAEPPNRADPKSAWVDYAVALGADRDDAENLSKSELIEKYG